VVVPPQGKSVDIGVVSVRITVIRETPEVTVRIEKVPQPSLASRPSEKVFSYLKISADRLPDDDIQAVTIEFNVPTVWLQENSVSEDDIVLLRLGGDRWTVLDTKLVGKEADVVTYKAVSAGLSVFSIGSFSDLVVEFIENLDSFGDPYIERLEPSSGAPGIEATFLGRNFNNVPGIQQVYFGGDTAKVKAGTWTDTRIVVKVPSCSGTVDVTVGPFPSSNSVRFVCKAPRVEVISPQIGTPGTEVHIRGNDFGDKGISLGYQVKFGNSLAKVNSWSDTEIIAVSPSDYGTGIEDADLLASLLGLASAKTVGEALPDLADRLLHVTGLNLVDLKLKEDEPGWTVFSKITVALALPGVTVTPEGDVDVVVAVTTPAGVSEEVLFTYRVPPPSTVVASTPSGGSPLDSGGKALTSTGFYYPTGAKPPYKSAGWHAGCLRHLGCDSLDSYLGGLYHLAQDMEGTVGDPVLAISDGEVVYVSVHDWGLDFTDENFGLLVKHKSADGSSFYALYGHVLPDDSSLLGRVDSGWIAPPIAVKGGEQFAVIGSFGNSPHVHFGIISKASLPGGSGKCKGWGARPINPCWGTGAAQQDGGFVEPLSWLATHSPTKPRETPLADLTISAQLEDSYKSGQRQVPVQVTVSLTGGELTEGDYVSAQLFWSTDTIWDRDQDSVLWQSSRTRPDFLNATLNNSGSNAVAATVNIPTVSSEGTYYIIAVVNADSFHPETDGGNNATAYAVSVINPDLSVTLAANPSSGPAPLSDVHLTATVSGTATGTVNYTFYCERPDSGIEITTGWVAKFDGVSDTFKTAVDACDYSNPGTYTAKVIAERGSAPQAEARATITVGAVPVASVAVTPSTALVSEGNTIQLGATPQDAAGNALTGRSITWSSSNTGVATVTQVGLVSGVAQGSAMVTATSEGISGTASITVDRVLVASVAVTPSTALVSEGNTIQLGATPQDAAGNVLTGRSITWSSGNPAVATVTQTGVVTGIAPGTVTVAATSEGISGTASITVKLVLVAPPSMSPTSLDFGTAATQKTFAITSPGEGTLTWSVSDNQAWLGATPTSGSTTSETDTITVTVDRAGLAAGSYSGTITVTSNGGSKTVPVSMRVVGSPTARIDMSSGGKSAVEDQVLNLTVAPGGSASVSFSAVRSSDADGSITAYDWKIEGQTKSTLRDFISQPLVAGTHQILLTVTDNDGLTGSVGASVVVTEQQQKPCPVVPATAPFETHPSQPSKATCAW